MISVAAILRSWPLTLGLVILVMAGCTSNVAEKSQANVPLVVSRPGSNTVDLDVVYRSAERAVHEVLPNAYFRMMIYSSSCGDLLALEGKLVLVSERVRFSLPLRQVLRASVSVDTRGKVMDIVYHDDSAFRPAVQRVVFAGDNTVKAVFTRVMAHLRAAGVTACDVTVTQVDDLSWKVKCHEESDGIVPCGFSVVDGQIKPEAP